MTVPSQNILTVNPVPSLSDEVNDVRLPTAKIVAAISSWRDVIMFFHD